MGVTRPGFELTDAHLPADTVTLVEVPAMAISSTDCRTRVAAGKPVWYLVPDGVEATAAVNVAGTNTTIGGDIEVNTNGSWTNNAGSTLAPTNVVVTGGTFVYGGYPDLDGLFGGALKTLARGIVLASRSRTPTTSWSTGRSA